MFYHTPNFDIFFLFKINNNLVNIVFAPKKTFNIKNEKLYMGPDINCATNGSEKKREIYDVEGILKENVRLFHSSAENAISFHLFVFLLLLFKRINTYLGQETIYRITFVL